MKTNKKDITLTDLDNVVLLLSKWQELLAEATRDWETYTRKQQLKLIKTFDTIGKICDGFKFEAAVLTAEPIAETEVTE